MVAGVERDFEQKCLVCGHACLNILSNRTSQSPLLTYLQGKVLVLFGRQKAAARTIVRATDKKPETHRDEDDKITNATKSLAMSHNAALKATSWGDEERDQKAPRAAPLEA